MRLGLKMYQVITKLIGGKGIGKLPIIMQLNKQVISKLRSDTAIIDGHKMFLDKGDSLSLSIKLICLQLIPIKLQWKSNSFLDCQQKIASTVQLKPEKALWNC